jgi:hypothetical protein
VAWAWDGGSSTVTNTDGSISAQVRANPSAGFSIVSYTGTGANASVGHGLNAAPKFLIIKNRTDAENWFAWHGDFPIPTRNGFYLDLTADVQNFGLTSFNDTVPSNSTITLGTSNLLNGSGNNIVAYCFAPVEQYSSFGSYLGNGSADGPFVFTGFRPRWIMVKRTDTGNSNTSWAIYDTARSSNPNKKYLLANTSAVEGNYYDVDLLSNGFKLRLAGDTTNQTSGTYIYAAFAEHPQKYSRAR